MLRSALETLTSPGQRKEYDERLQLGESREEVPSEYLAGVLCLMFEAGNWQAVLTVGENWLSQHKNHRSVRDVAILTALSHREIAKQLALQQTVAETHAMLEVAAKILAINKAADSELYSSLQAEADSLRPQLTIQLLSSRDPSARAKGITLLPWAIESFAFGNKAKNYAAGQPGPETGAMKLQSRQSFQADAPLNRTRFFDHLRRLLTAEEYVEAFETAESEIKREEFTADEFYKAAIAYIAVGTLRSVGRPSSISRAVALLERAERSIDAQTSCLPRGETGQQAMLQARKLMDERRKYAVALAVCFVLLGQNSKAIECIGLHDGRPRCDRQVFAFIRANSPRPNTDPLPGLYVLSNMWIADVVATAFGSSSSSSSLSHPRNDDTHIPAFSLDAWFQNPDVLRELSNKNGSSSSPFGLSIPVGLRNLGTVISSTMTSFFTKSHLVEENEEGEEYSASALQVPPSLQQVGGNKQASDLINTSDPADSNHSSFRSAIKASEDLDKLDELEDGGQWSYREGRTMYRNELHGNVSDSPRSDDQQEIAYDGEEQEQEQEQDGFPLQPDPLKDIQTLYPGEDDWMRSAYEARSIRWGRVASSILFVLGILFVLLFASMRRVNGLRGFIGQASTPVVTSTNIAKISVTQAATISHSEATKLIARWQKVKASALGAKHDIDMLSTVLAGDLLTQWTDKATALAGQGVHYTHKLAHSKVNMVKPGPRDGTWTLKAEFTEEVTAHKSSGPQKFTSKYGVVYTAEMFGPVWKLTSAQVLAPL